MGTCAGQQRTDTRVTEGDPANIRMSASNDLMADGRDISYVDLVITDEKGNRCYTAADSLSVHVHGAAMPLLSNRIAADAGLARVAVRSNGKPGAIRITADGKGLNDGEISLKAVED